MIDFLEAFETMELSQQLMDRIRSNCRTHLTHLMNISLVEVFNEKIPRKHIDDNTSLLVSKLLDNKALLAFLEAIKKALDTETDIPPK